MQDLELLTVGMVIDMAAAKSEMMDTDEPVRQATQADFDNF